MVAFIEVQHVAPDPDDWRLASFDTCSGASPISSYVLTGRCVALRCGNPLIGVRYHALVTLMIATWHFKSYVLDLHVRH